jgi:hypothetical protein
MSSILADQQRPRLRVQMRGEGRWLRGQPMSTAVHFEDLIPYLICAKSSQEVKKNNQRVLEVPVK